MSEMNELYQAVILDHNQRPQNFGKLESATHHAEGYNPLCGDQLTVYLEVQDGVLKEVRFEGSGCAISKASASLMTAGLKGKSIDEADRIFHIFHRMVKGEGEDDGTLGKLAVFAGVREFPMRVKCATLGWHTLRGALEGRNEPITTE